MNVADAARQVESALASPLAVWSGYSPASIPMVLFDEETLRFFNHPDPSQQRPPQIVAASVVQINGLWTATVPVQSCQDETDLVPLVYHECFHAYQRNGAFLFDEQFDFFRSLAYYPELDAAYRALCLAEVDLLENSGLAPRDKAVQLAALAGQRQAILAEQLGLLAFVQHLERLEGTAFFVEQQVRARQFGVPPQMFSPHFGGVVASPVGWTRHHAVGAAICRLLDELVEHWQAPIADGTSLSGLLIDRYGQRQANLDDLDLPGKVAHEQQAVARIQAGLEDEVTQLKADGITIQWSADVSLTRALSPTAAISLGNGRLLHGAFLILQLSNGTIELRGGHILEDYNRHEVTFPAVPVAYSANQLQADTDTAQVALSGVSRVGENEFRVQ